MKKKVMPSEIRTQPVAHRTTALFLAALRAFLAEDSMASQAARLEKSEFLVLTRLFQMAASSDGLVLSWENASLSCHNLSVSLSVSLIFSYWLCAARYSF